MMWLTTKFPSLTNRVVLIFLSVGILLTIIVLISFYVFNRNEPRKPATSFGSPIPTIVITNTPGGDVSELVWHQTQSGWQAVQTPPTCPSQPMMQVPTDLQQVTAILYPGQTRGGNYKPHGGFRFDNSLDNKILVTAPIDGYAVRGGRYLAEGEIQYTFDIMNNCGVMYRVGHLRELPDNLQKIADTWPAAQEGDSRTQEIRPALFIKQGTPLATAVGITKNKNAFFDWGVYDYRQTNAASASSAYQQAHAADKELSWHAVCWFDWVSTENEATIRSLPAGDPGSGKTSDYCK